MEFDSQSGYARRVVPQSQTTNQQNGFLAFVRIIISTIIIVVIVIGGIALFDAFQKDQARTQQNKGNPSGSYSLIQTKKMIIDQTFHVNNLSYMSFTVNLTSATTNLMGTFSAEGGKNDIRCIIVDDDNFVNFQNSTDFREFFDSRYVARGNVNVNLAAGVYHIIFTNQAALFTSKTVTAHFETQ